jgi:hypothetical protein
MLVLDGNIRVLRARYLFDLAAICHCPPPVVDQLRLRDFASLIAGLNQMRAQNGVS